MFMEKEGRRGFGHGKEGRNERGYGILKLDINGGKSRQAGRALIQLEGSCIFLDYASNLQQSQAGGTD